MPCARGPECCWGNRFAPDPPVVMPRGRWVCLELQMRLNTPGQADGAMAFWVDDRLALDQPGMHWRDDPTLRLNKAWLQHYIAAGDADQSNQVWFDDVVVSTQRVGCGGPAVAPTSVPTVAPSVTSTLAPGVTSTPTPPAPLYLPLLDDPDADSRPRAVLRP
jgi:hypothetical protein